MTDVSEILGEEGDFSLPKLTETVEPDSEVEIHGIRFNDSGQYGKIAILEIAGEDADETIEVRTGSKVIVDQAEKIKSGVGDIEDPLTAKVLTEEGENGTYWKLG